MQPQKTRPNHPPPLPPDLQGPLASARFYHPESWAPASVQLTVAAFISACLLFCLTLHWRLLTPSTSWALAASTIALGLFLAIGFSGRQRGGPLLPRLGTLAFLLVSAMTTMALASWNGKAPETWRAAALALLAAACCLFFRFLLAGKAPHQRVLAYSGLVGTFAGVVSGLCFRTAELAFNPTGSFRLDSSAAAFCRDLATFAGQDLRPTLQGRNPRPLDELARLSAWLSESPADWDSLSHATHMTCDAAAAALSHFLEHGHPTPGDLADPIFQHGARPAQAGELAEQMPTDPEPARRLYRDLGYLSRGLATRLDSRSDARRRLEMARNNWTTTLSRSWLDQWLLPAWQPESPAPELIDLLLEPPGLPAGRPDRWLRLPLTDANRLAIEEPACAMRSIYEATSERQQVIDCGLLGVTTDGRLDLVGELSLVYASSPRAADRLLPEISPYALPRALRLLIEKPPSAPTTLLEALSASLARQGGTSTRIDEWSFEVVFPDGQKIQGRASQTSLPGGRSGIAFSFSQVDL